MIFKHLSALLVSFLILVCSMSLQTIAYAESTPQFTFKRNQDKEGRLSYAKELSKFFQELDAFIPSLSPSQREWLDKELKEYEKTKNTSRYVQIINTKEYRINDIKMYIGRVSSILDSIHNSTELKNEIYMWALMSEFLLKVNFWSDLHIAIEEHGIIDKKFFYSDPNHKIDQYSFYLNNGVIPATQIISFILQSYLNGELIR